MSVLEKWLDLKREARSELSKPRSAALEYIHGYRKIPKEVIGRYSVGYLRGDSMSKLLAFSPTKPDTIPKLASRDWLTFFIEGLRGMPLGVEIRSIQDKVYIRIPFEKSRVHPALFGLSESFDLIAEHGRLVLLEGCLELLTFATITRYPALTTMTAGTTMSQERWLWRWGHQKIILFYNSDEKGKRSAKYLIKKWLRLGINAVDSRWYETPGVSLRREKDLNDLLQQQGPGAVRSVIEYGIRR